MTVSSATNRKTFAGNGATTSFATSPVNFYESSDLDVYVVNDTTNAVTTLVEDTDYSVTGGDGSTGTVSLAGGGTPYGAPASGTTLVIARTLPLTQATDFVNNDASDADVVEQALDKLTMMLQQLGRNVGNSFYLPDSDTSGVSLVVPDAVTRAGTIIGFDEDGNIEYIPVENYDPNATVTQQIWIPGAAMMPVISPLAPPDSFAVARNLVSGGTEANIPQFVNVGMALNDIVEFTIAFPNGWDGGTITYKPYYLIATSSAVSGTKVKFSLAGVAMGDAELLDDAFGTAIGVEDTPASPAGYKHYIGDTSAAVTIAGTPADNDLCFFRLKRIAAASDDITDDITLLGIKISFTAAVSDA